MGITESLSCKKKNIKIKLTLNWVIDVQRGEPETWPGKFHFLPEINGSSRIYQGFIYKDAQNSGNFWYRTSASIIKSSEIFHFSI